METEQLQQTSLNPELSQTSRIYTKISSVIIGLSLFGYISIILLATLNLYGCDFMFCTKGIAFIDTIGLATLIAGASYMGGGLGGFLFGIPKISEGIPGNQNTAPKVIQNDNLVQVSDWLTKILVGVSLTQLHNIPTLLHHFGVYIAETKGFVIPSQAWQAIAVFYVIAGFSSSYLWTRIYFTKLLNISITELSGQPISKNPLNS